MMAKMVTTVTCTPRHWWRAMGRPGTLLLWLGLKCDLPFAWFFRVSVE